MNETQINHSIAVIVPRKMRLESILVERMPAKEKRSLLLIISLKWQRERTQSQGKRHNCNLKRKVTVMI
jgi:hypothetical protein